jgi:glycosyltransferase involved in cell wall biosynthesis
MQQKPTILHLINTLGLGGAEILFANTLPLLPDYDHVICYLSAPYDLAPRLPDHPTYCLNHKGMKGALGTLMRLRKVIRKHRPDIIHTHLLESTWLGRLACPRKTAFAFSVHSIMSEDAFKPNPASLRMEKLTMRKRHNLIGVSETVVEDYVRHTGFSGGRFVLYNFVPDAFFRPERLQAKGEQRGVLRCVSVGNLKAVKNQAYILEALSLLKGMPISLDIYGEGPLRGALQGMIDAEGLDVRLMGARQDISGLLGGYDLFIGTSLHEGYGLVVLEAMAAGLPVVLSDIPVFREISGGHALFANLSNPETLAVLLRRLLSREKETDRMVKDAYEHAERIARKEIYSKSLHNIYNKVLNKKA